MKISKKLLAMGSHLTLAAFFFSVACTHQQDRLISSNELNSYNEGGSVDGEVSNTEVAATETAAGETATAPSEDLTATGQAIPEEVAIATDTPSKEVSDDLSTLSKDIAPSSPSETKVPELMSMPSNEAATLTTPNASSTENNVIIPSETVAASSEATWTPEGSAALDTPVASTTEKPAVTTEVTSGKSSVSPKMPASPMVRKGQTMNRYYYLRTGDTAESLSELFYGSKDHAAELTGWNGEVSTWKAGNPVYFVSADQPDDTEMSSFYEEQGITSEVYVVQKGDQLSTIAQSHYGTTRSWKEIAAFNNLANPDRIVPGQELSLLPKAMKTIQKATVAMDTPVSVPLTSEVKTEEKATVAQSGAHSQALTEDDAEALEAQDKSVVKAEALPKPVSQAEKAKAADLAAMNLEPESSSLGAFALGGGLFLLGLFLVLLRRARNRARAEFME